MSNEPDEVNNGALATIIVIVALATLGIALVVTSLVREETAALSAQKEVSTPQDAAYRQLKAAQLAEITAGPAWRDRQEGLVSIPIERAMELVAESVRENPFNLSPGSPPEEEEEVEGTEVPAEGEPGAEVLPGAEGTTSAENPGGDVSVPTNEEPAPSQKVVPTKPVPGLAPAQPAAPVKPAPAPVKPAPAPVKPAPVKPAPAPVPAPAP